MEIVFLGTGPAGGVKGLGKSKRFESSALIRTKNLKILIDITRDFQMQSKWIKRVDAILITHAHKDAIGGINQLRGIQIPLYSLPLTIAKIKQKFKQTANLELIPIKSFKPFHIDEIKVTPFKVSHSIQPGFPTLGFQIREGEKKLVYVSDTGGWKKLAESIMQQADLLVIDGAMWGKKMVAHLDIKDVLPKICKWPIKKIIFTQIGHSAPKHEVLQREIQKICPKALPAYDGMHLTF